MQLDVESLRTFLAVVDHGGMTRAAERLNLSQSAVSWKMKRLEERVGRPLLTRDGHKIRPTRDGRQLIDDARSLVEIHDRAAARLAGSDLSGSVILGSNEEVDPQHMAAVLGRFSRCHPRTTVEFVIDETAHLVEQLSNGTIDVAIIQVDDDGLRSDDVVLWTDELRWLMSRERPVDDDETVPLITFGPHCFYRALSEPILEDAGIDHRITFAAGSIAAVRAAIASGLGVGVLGARYLGDDLVVWPPSHDLARMPVIHQIVRTAPGDTSEVTNTLVTTIADELQAAGVAASAA
ncbi:MAG: LysR family transcriptional regulator [Ilumatobacter sp.]